MPQLCAVFLALLVLTGCGMTTSPLNSSDAGCIAYQANRPKVSEGDSLPTMMDVLNLDYAMEAACS